MTRDVSELRTGEPHRAPTLLCQRPKYTPYDADEDGVDHEGDNPGVVIQLLLKASPKRPDRENGIDSFTDLNC